MLNSTDHEFQLLIKLKYRQIKMFLALSLSDVVFIMLINVKMPTIVGILTFMSRINFVLSWVEYEKSFISSGPGSKDIVHGYSLLGCHYCKSILSLPKYLNGLKYFILLPYLMKVYEVTPQCDTILHIYKMKYTYSPVSL